MAYTKQTWVDEVLSGSPTYTISGVGSGKTISLDTAITTAGTSFTATLMNKIEQGVYLTNNKFDNTSANDTYTVTIDGVTSYTDIVGIPLTVKFTVANTDACTLNINSLGAKSIIRGISTALVTGDIIANQLCTVVYDGTSFQLLSQGQDVMSKTILTTQGDIIYATGASTPARLAKGTAGQVLQMNSGATAPEWGTAPARLITGQYTGDGNASQTISLGVTPKAVLVVKDGTGFDGGGSDTYGESHNGLAITSYPAISHSNNVVSITSGGFIVYYNTTPNWDILSNVNNNTYNYMAIY